MATKLLKPVKRELFSLNERGKLVTAALIPGDCLEFKVKGSRKQGYEIYLGHCFVLAQIMTFEKQYNDKVKEFKIKKDAGFKNLRKPKKPFLPYSKIYFDALK